MPKWDEIDSRRRAVLSRLQARAAGVRDCLIAYETRATARDEVDRAIRTLSGLHREREAMCRVAVRSVASFLPVNQPLYALVLFGVVPALMAGSVTVRPSVVTAPVVRDVWTTLGLDDVVGNLRIAATDRAGFVSRHVTSSDAVVFTGNHRAAVRVLKSLRRDAVFVYNGSGVNPVVVTADADLDRAVDGIVRGALYNSGQDCAAPDCVLVHRSVRDGVVDRLRARLRALTVGAAATGADVGPVARRESVDAFVGFVLDHADRVVEGGRVDVARRLVEPTVTVSDLHADSRFPELYAPVMNVLCFDDVAEVAAFARRDDYQRRAMYLTSYGTLPVGPRNTTVLVDRTVLDHEDGNAPFGGLGVEASFVKRPGRRPDFGPVLLSSALADTDG